VIAVQVVGSNLIFTLPIANGKVISPFLFLQAALREIKFSVAGRDTVLMMGFNLDDAGWAPLSIRRLAAGGLRRLLLLHSDPFACDAVRRFGISEVREPTC